MISLEAWTTSYNFVLMRTDFPTVLKNYKCAPVLTISHSQRHKQVEYNSLPDSGTRSRNNEGTSLQIMRTVLKIDLLSNYFPNYNISHSQFLFQYIIIFITKIFMCQNSVWILVPEKDNFSTSYTIISECKLNYKSD